MPHQSDWHSAAEERLLDGPGGAGPQREVEVWRRPKKLQETARKQVSPRATGTPSTKSPLSSLSSVWTC